MAGPALSVLIPAAGASTRLGQAKQLVNYRGKPLLEHVIDVVSSINPLEILVITGANSEAVRDTIRNPAVRWVHNPQWPEGLGGSIAIGAGAVKPESAGLMIMLSDQYRVCENDLLKLLDTWLTRPGRIVAAESGGRCMPPLIFPSTMFNELEKLSGETGARELLAQNPEQVMAVPLENAIFDLDSPEQLQNLQADRDS